MLSKLPTEDVVICFRDDDRLMRVMQFHPGIGVSCGRDFTLFSVEEGVVVFETIKRKKCVRLRLLQPCATVYRSAGERMLCALTVVDMHTVSHCWCDLQVSVYPSDHIKAQGYQLEKQPGSRASKRLEKWKGVPRNRDA